MMDELLHLCSWFEQSYGIDAEQDEQSGAWFKPFFELMVSEIISDEDDSYIRSLMREDAQKRLQVPFSKNSKFRPENRSGLEHTSRVDLRLLKWTLIAGK